MMYTILYTAQVCLTDDKAALLVWALSIYAGWPSNSQYKEVPSF